MCTPRTGTEIAALFMADRVAHNVNPVNGISAMLAQGRDVICDRYYYSSLAYQGVVSDPDWVFHINVDCPEIRRPDLCVFLDLDEEACIRRRHASSSRSRNTHRSGFRISGQSTLMWNTQSGSDTTP